MRLIPVLFAVVLGTGCYASTSGYVAGPSVGVTATTVAPDLVYVSPGVQVIADYDEPIFYSDGFYWRETGGVWYRSSYHTHGWAYYAPPRAVIGIRDRHSYRRYRPAGWAPRNRAYNPRPSYTARPAQRNVYDRRDQRWERRDNRAERRDNRWENRQERRDNRQERRNDRNDRRDDRRDRRR